MKSIFSLILCIACIFSCGAADFFSTETPSQFMNFGVRVGLNTSNVTASKKAFNGYNHNSWGIGFNAGIVADINIRDYIAIQPGFYYETRSGNYAYQQLGTSGTTDYQLGHLRSYYFTVPILGSLRFNIADNIRWIVNFGPYLSFRLNTDMKPKVSYTTFDPDGSESAKVGKLSNVDFGFRMGTGIKIYKHYYFGIHYNAAATRSWKDSYLGGHNRGWDFMIGFDI